jgi:hypothetical protein
VRRLLATVVGTLAAVVSCGQSLALGPPSDPADVQDAAPAPDGFASAEGEGGADAGGDVVAVDAGPPHLACETPTHAMGFADESSCKASQSNCYAIDASLPTSEAGCTALFDGLLFCTPCGTSYFWERCTCQ